MRTYLVNKNVCYILETSNCVSRAIPRNAAAHIETADYVQIKINKGHFMGLSNSFNPIESKHGHMDRYT